MVHFCIGILAGYAVLPELVGFGLGVKAVKALLGLYMHHLLFEPPFTVSG